MKFLFFLLAFSSFCACDNKQPLTLEKKTTGNFRKLVLVDTFSNNLSSKICTSKTSTAFHPMYIGEWIDSIPLTYYSRAVENRTRDWEKYKRPDSTDLLLFVDTTRIIGEVETFILTPPPPPYSKVEWRLKYARGNTRSYPVFVSNTSPDSLEIGYGEYLSLLLEAQDSTGKWKPIQRPFIYGCGTGLTKFFLLPKEFALTSCPLFEGDYETLLRLRFGHNKGAVSNTFRGRIYYGQFEEQDIYGADY